MTTTTKSFKPVHTKLEEAIAREAMAELIERRRTTTPRLG